MNSKLRVGCLFPVFISFLVVVTSFAQEKAMPELRVVPTVDLQEYAGTWYEIARLPNSFQNDCAGDVTATYVIDDDGIEVTNRCRTADGKMKEAKGRARVASKDGPSTKLKVRFAPAFLSFLPFVWGDYWIIDLAADYSYAVVGEPSRRYLWILSRKPQIDETVLEGILDRVRSQGYDDSKLIMTIQTVK
jgi:apolipoprotein D and lipocalin family protein